MQKLITVFLFISCLVLVSACTATGVDPQLQGDLKEYILSNEEFPLHDDLFFISSILDIDYQQLAQDNPEGVEQSLQENETSDGIRANYNHRDQVRQFSTKIHIYLKRFSSAPDAEVFFSENWLFSLDLNDVSAQPIEMPPAQQAEFFEQIFREELESGDVAYAVRFQYENLFAVVFATGDPELITAEFVQELASAQLDKLATLAD